MGKERRNKLERVGERKGEKSTVKRRDRIKVEREMEEGKGEGKRDG